MRGNKTKFERNSSQEFHHMTYFGKTNHQAKETWRELGRVNFRKDFWDCYYGQGKTISEFQTDAKYKNVLVKKGFICTSVEIHFLF